MLISSMNNRLSKISKTNSSFKITRLVISGRTNPYQYFTTLDFASTFLWTTVSVAKESDLKSACAKIVLRKQGPLPPPAHATSRFVAISSRTSCPILLPDRSWRLRINMIKISIIRNNLLRPPVSPAPALDQRYHATSKKCLYPGRSARPALRWLP